MITSIPKNYPQVSEWSLPRPQASILGVNRDSGGACFLTKIRRKSIEGPRGGYRVHVRYSTVQYVIKKGRTEPGGTSMHCDSDQNIILHNIIPVS